MRKPAKRTSASGKLNGAHRALISSHVLDRFVTDAGRSPILRVPNDVLQEIFGFLDRRSCFSVARSCKRLKEPALDQLWSEVTTLVAPLRLMDELINTSNGWVSALDASILNIMWTAAFLNLYASHLDVPQRTRSS